MAGASIKQIPGRCGTSPSNPGDIKDTAVAISVTQGPGAYGFVLLFNTSMVGKFDSVWVFATQNNIQNLIQGEADRMYQESLLQ